MLTPVPDNSQLFQIDPSTEKIYVMNTDNKSISVIDGKTNKLVTDIPIKSQHRTFFDTVIDSYRSDNSSSNCHCDCWIAYGAF
jgi:YVTN family beta-propeller protein